jgi:hypothetical protein
MRLGGRFRRLVSVEWTGSRALSYRNNKSALQLDVSRAVTTQRTVLKTASYKHWPIREIRIRIYLPFWPDKVMRDLHCWGWQQASFSACSFSLVHDVTCTWHSGWLHSAYCLYPVHITWMACWKCWNNITSQCKAMMTLSDHKGKNH